MSTRLSPVSNTGTRALSRHPRLLVTANPPPFLHRDNRAKQRTRFTYRPAALRSAASIARSTVYFGVTNFTIARISIIAEKI